MLGKKKDNKRSTEANKAAKPVSAYFIPIMIVGVICAVVLGIFITWILGQHANARQEQSAKSVVAVIGLHLQSVVEAKQDLLNVVASDSLVHEALTDNSVLLMSRARQLVKQRLPSASQVQLISSARGEDGLLSGMTGGFATQDLLRRTIEGSAKQNVEAHQLASNSPIVAIAVPVMLGRSVLGALYASFPMDLVSSAVKSATPSRRGGVGLVQVIGGESVTLVQTPGYNQDRVMAETLVPGTLWKVRYSGASGLVSDTAQLLGLILLAVAGVILVTWMQQRNLARDIKNDMGMTVSLMDATLKRKGTPTTVPKLRESEAAIAVLIKYAQATYAASKAADVDKNKAGMPQTKLEPAESEPSRSQEAARATLLGELPESIFRACDVRGIAGETLLPETAQLLGQAVGTLALQDGEKSIIVGRDVRVSSAELCSELVAGILSTGCDVIDLAIVPSPLVYFATHILASRSAIMVTGGHNPPQYNGFKIIVGGEYLSEQALQDLREHMLSGKFRSGSGTLENKEISGEYIRKITADVQLSESPKVVVDGGNGAGGALLARLLGEMGCEVMELFCDPDGTFPNRGNDPSQPENLSTLAMEVQAQGAALGIALDADGDRLALVDERGKHIFADQLLMLLADDIVSRHPGADVVYDIKSSGNLASHILSHGGRPIMWKSGHTRIKAKMRETGALLGGSFSGHIFIRERWFGFDDALYAAARLLEIFAGESQPVSRLFQELPTSIGTPEFSLPVKEGEAFEIMDKLKKNAVFGDADIIDVDGLRAEFSDGWALVKASNTMPALVFRFEAENRAALERLKELMRDRIQSVLRDATIPF